MQGGGAFHLSVQVANIIPPSSNVWLWISVGLVIGLVFGSILGCLLTICVMKMNKKKNKVMLVNRLNEK